MNEAGFKDFLKKLGYTQSSIKNNLSFNLKNEGLAIDLFDCRDLDEVVLDDSKMVGMINWIHNNNPWNRPTEKESTNALRLYYYFKNNKLYDNWEPNPRGKQKAKKCELPPTGFDENCYYVRYEEGIPDENKIPGLTRYLDEEYEKIILFAEDLLSVDYGRIPVILSEKKEESVYKYDSYDAAKQILDNVNKRIELSIEQVKRIIDSVGIKRFSKIGAFYHHGYENVEGPCIVIYYRYLNKGTIDEYFAQASQVLSHEYFHYIHYRSINNNVIFDDKSFEATAVKEALADCFSVFYLISEKNPALIWNKKKAAKERYVFWEDYFLTAVPYANALWFYLIDNRLKDYLYRNLDKFFRVFEISLRSMNDAYFNLIS